jgi:DNA polymerase-3 subunit delta
MYKEGYTEYDISRNLNVHPYRVKLAYNMDITINESLEYIKKLSELDRNIKSGAIDKKYAFEKFIIELK